MALPKCLVVPERSNYTGTPGIDVVANALDGGLSRTRQDQLGCSELVTVQWSVGINDYNYLRAFKRQYSSGPFLIDLILDHAVTDEYTALIVPGTWNLNSQSGVTYVVQASLEVAPLPFDANGDLEILARN